MAVTARRIKLSEGGRRNFNAMLTQNLSEEARKSGQSKVAKIAKIAKPTVETSDKVRLNLEKFVWSSREK
jgi:hypothetical protein